MIRTFRRLSIVLGCLAVIGLSGYQIWLDGVRSRELVAPSTAHILVTADGREIPLAPLAVGAISQSPAGHRGVKPAAARGGATLPPERLLIPAIGADWPIVLATAEHLPHFRGVGWLMGSAAPGRPGNMVLFGHRGGDFATLARLPELRVGDAVIVLTAEAELRYQVRETFETTPDDVAVLAPTAEPTLTLITCAGTWDAVARTNALRRIVVASLSDVQPLTRRSADVR